MARHSGDFVGVVAQGVVAILGLQGVDVYGAVRGLGGDELVERIPCHALDVVVMLCDLADQCACGSRLSVKHLHQDPPLHRRAAGPAIHTTCSVVDASNIVHAANDEIVAVWGPGKVVDLGA